MKTFRLFLFLSVFAAIGIYSCTDSEAIKDNQTTTRQSVALRTALNEIKKANPGKKTTGRTADSALCFNFVYPVTLSYSNATNTNVTVTSFEGLLDLLGNETANQYLSAIAYPFQITQGGAVTTIADEAAFTAAIQACGVNTLNQDLDYTYCFDLVFPITVGLNGQTLAIDTAAQFQAFLQTPANGTVSIVFPISATYQGQVVVIHNLYELYDMINNCNGCICTQEYAPVCVQTATGIQEFGNLCYAICAGYTQNDLVPCNGNGPYCDIAGVSVVPGTCNTDGTYPLTINFTVVNATGSQFEVYTNANVLVGTYNLSALPLTIPNYPSNSQAADYLTIRIAGLTGCTSTQQWAVPSCGCNCAPDTTPVCVMTNTGLVTYDNACLAQCAGHTPAEFVNCNPSNNYNFGALLGTCFTMQYPLFVQYQGALQVVDVDGTLLQYWFPAQNPMPAFNYPVTVNFGASTFTVTTQAQFEALIAQHCN